MITNYFAYSLIAALAIIFTNLPAFIASEFDIGIFILAATREPTGSASHPPIEYPTQPTGGADRGTGSAGGGAVGAGRGTTPAQDHYDLDDLANYGLSNRLQQTSKVKVDDRVHKGLNP